MSGDENDEDLKRAIALSLREDTPPRNSNRSIIEISDDEDDDLDAPVKARLISSDSRRASSKQNEKARSCKASSKTNENRDAAPSSDSTPIVMSDTLSSGVLGLNRKQMEQERLARLNASKLVAELGDTSGKKRKADIAFRDNPTDRSMRAKTPGIVIPKNTTGMTPSQRGIHNLELSAPIGIQYPDGVVKKTWVKGHDRSGDDIKIEEVLQRDTLELAVLSTFQIDAEWISGKINDKTRVFWILQAKSESEKENWRDDVNPKYRFCFP